MIYKIPFNKASLSGKEYEYIGKAIAEGHISGDGLFTRKCSAELERMLGVKKSLLTTSCTHALEMSALLLGLGPGDEIIIPSFAFVSCSNAYALFGAKPVFSDIRPDTLNIDENKIEGLITSRTKAILCLHYAGVACEMDKIMQIAGKHKLAVIEDNAHGLTGLYYDRKLGSFGDLATLSFHETKNITCGEGGSLLINNAAYIERAEIIREKGTDRSKFFRGQVDKYTWVDVGSSYLPSDILAAFLCAQLENIEMIQKKRERIWNTYYESLSGWAKENNVVLPIVPAHCQQSYHMFYMLMPTFEQRQHLIQRLKKNGILAVFHYLPLHLSPMGGRYSGIPVSCPISENISDRIIRLPFYTSMSCEDQQFVIDTIIKA